MGTSADISLTRDGDAMVAEVRGEVDMTNAALVREELTGAVPTDAACLIVDLASTRYLDSAAIEVLFELSRRLGRRRQALQLIVPEDSPLKRVLMLTGIGSVAPVHERLDDALAR